MLKWVWGPVILAIIQVIIIMHSFASLLHVIKKWSFFKLFRTKFFLKFWTVGRRRNLLNDHLFYVLHEQLSILYLMNLYPRQWGGDIIFFYLNEDISQT